MRAYYRSTVGYAYEYITPTIDGGNYYFNQRWIRGSLPFIALRHLVPISTLELRLRGVPEFEE